MVYYDVQPLGDLIKEFYELHKGSDYMDEMKVVSLWGKVVGPFITSHTIDLFFKNHTLFVRVDSDVLRNELGYSKSLLIQNLNEAVGKSVVEEIVLS